MPRGPYIFCGQDNKRQGNTKIWQLQVQMVMAKVTVAFIIIAIVVNHLYYVTLATIVAVHSYYVTL